MKLGDLKRGKRKTAEAVAPAGDRLPPHSPEAEVGVLSCLLLEPLAGLNECEERGVQWGWFYDLKHQVIFDTMRSMHKEGQAVDVITLYERLKGKVELPAGDGVGEDGAGGQSVGAEEVGGVAYLSHLAGLVPSAANLGYYLEILHEKFLMRMLVRVCAQASGAVYEHEGSIEELLGKVEKQVLALTERRVEVSEAPIKQILTTVIAELEDYHRGHAQIRGLTMGLDYLDKILCGIGGKNGNYIVISARPGVGKTSLALDVVLHAALDYVWWDPVMEVGKDGQKKAAVEIGEDGQERVKCAQRMGVPVGIFSLEMTKESLAQRMLFQRARADLQRWRTGFANNEDLRPLVNAMGRIGKTNIWVDDSGRCTVDSFKAKARRWHRQHGIKLFVLDYIQLMRAGGKRFREDRVQELSEISGEIQALGKELNVPILVLAQMNRDYEKEPNRRPRLSDLKDCGSIEQDADLVLFLYEGKLNESEEEKLHEAMEAEYGNDWSKQKMLVNMLVAKNRYGPANRIAQALFHRECTHFEDYGSWLKAKGHRAPAAGEPKRKQLQMPTDEEMGD